MGDPTHPRFPLYIPSKSRSDTATTPHVLDKLGVDHRIIVEEHQHDAYAEVFGEDRLLILPKRYQDEYDTFDDLGDAKSKGPGPARNFAWDHAIDQGADWHWVMDDNIMRFARLHQNQRIEVGDGTIFHAMETFALRYENVGQVGPNYWMFTPNRDKLPPFLTNTRIYSCNLIRNDLPFRWRGRYNEDTDLSLRMLKAGWCTVQFYAFLQDKLTTQRMGGGNTEAFYANEGTAPKSRMLVRMHPDVARLTWRFGRIHHHVDYSRFKNLRLIRKDGYQPPEQNPYRLVKVARDDE